MLEKFERIKLGHFPTPIEHLENISKYLGGPNIFIKRDDCTGLATGGNKTRKLEFLIPDAIKNNAELIDSDNKIFKKGDFVTFEPGSSHSSYTKIGCLLLVFQRARNELLKK